MYGIINKPFDDEFEGGIETGIDQDYEEGFDDYDESDNDYDDDDYDDDDDADDDYDFDDLDDEELEEYLDYLDDLCDETEDNFLCERDMNCPYNCGSCSGCDYEGECDMCERDGTSYCDTCYHRNEY